MSGGWNQKKGALQTIPLQRALAHLILFALYAFLIKRLKAFYSAAGLRPLPLKNEVNTFLTAAQAVCRETAFIK